MGIPRLTQDIAPFAESVTLGKDIHWEGTPRVSRVVIDGPSLVYHIYNLVLKKQLADDSQLSRDDGAFKRKLVSYSSVNDAVVEFLQLLYSLGVVVVRIFFDGSLPVNKHNIRCERLEKARQQLEAYRLSNPTKPLCQASSCSLNGLDSKNSLWQENTLPGSLSKLPIPAFIVPSVIERLASDTLWRQLMDVVNGESDPYCANLAAQSAAAVLSNDSDLVVHDLGSKGSVISFGSLQLSTDDKGAQALKGSCWKPKSVAASMGIANLQHYAYQRSLDAQATSRVIAERTRAFQNPSHLEDSGYMSFLCSFTPPSSTYDHDIMSPRQLTGLDPRTSELICALDIGHTPKVYLPILFEDPTRDAPWTYGRDLRRITYSMLLLYHTNDADADAVCSQKNVIEFARRGRSIKDALITTYSSQQTMDCVRDLLERIRTCLTISTSQQSQMLGYYVFAASVVEAHKCSDARSCMAEISHLMSLRDDTNYEPTWSDVHILANLQAVLYSLRMMKQVFTYVVRNFPPHLHLQHFVEDILKIVTDMPAIEDLFLDATHIWHSFRAIPLKLRTAAYHKIASSAGAEAPSHKQIIVNKSVLKSTQQESQFIQPQKSRAKKQQNFFNAKKRSAEHDTADFDEKAIERNSRKVKMESNNPFSLLDEA